MTQLNYDPFRFVSVHDNGWIIEAFKFNPDFDAQETRAYPGWFFRLLTGQDQLGYAVAYHPFKGRWILSDPTGPDSLLDDGDWLCKNPMGAFFMLTPDYFIRDYRHFDLDVDLEPR